MATNFVLRRCSCGQQFASEGELSLHQRHCDSFKRADVDQRLVEPLRKELHRLDGEANGIYVALAQALGHYAQGHRDEARYKHGLAANSHQHTLYSLSDLVNNTAEVAKNRHAIVNALQTQLKDLVWRFNDLNSILQSSRSLLDRRDA